MDSATRISSLASFLADWTPALLLGGGLCLLLGILAGWIIWRNARKLSESIESRNREALADFERASDEVSKIKAQLSGEDD